MNRERSSFSWRPGSLARRWWSEFRRPRGDLPWFKRVRRRFLLWLPIVVPAILILGGLSVYLGVGLRARYLASEGMRSVSNDVFERGYRQIMVAHSLRPDDPAVHRAWVYVRSRTGEASMLPEWEALAAAGQLTPLEAKEYARLAVISGGNEAKSTEAIGLLESLGEPAYASGLRAALNAQRGDYSNAIAQARAAVAAGGDDELRLDLLRYLCMRYGSSLKRPRLLTEEDEQALAEIMEVTESLRGTDLHSQALAKVLPEIAVPRTTAWAWAQEALQARTAENLALLPAADLAIETGAQDPSDLAEELAPVFAQATLERRAAFATWLNRHRRSDLVPDLLSADEAVSNPLAFTARAEALFNLGQWPALEEMSIMESPVPPSVRLAARAVAARQLGQESDVPELVAQSLDNAARDKSISAVVPLLDSYGLSALVDDILLGLCSREDIAAEVYPLARSRFKGRGDDETLLRALDAAGQAVPNNLAVLDSRRRGDLLAGRPVDPSETAAAVAVAPADIALRLTHSLALFRAGRYAEALSVYDQVDVFISELPPGEQAIVYAVLASNEGQSFNATRLLRAIERFRLTPDEEALLSPTP